MVEVKVWVHKDDERPILDYIDVVNGARKSAIRAQAQAGGAV
jgi:hypothetical protein